MSQPRITLSYIEEKPDTLPEDVVQVGQETTAAIWRTTQNLAQQEISKIRVAYQQFEVEVLQARQAALDEVEAIKVVIANTQAQLEAQERENASLQVDLTDRNAELKSAEDRISDLREQNTQQDIEIKRLAEELGRSRETVDVQQKRLYEVSHQARQDRDNLKDVQEELLVNQKNRERLERNLKEAIAESEQVWKQLKTEQTRAAIADTQVKEMRETVKKLDNDIKLLKEEKQDLKEQHDNEIRLRVELEKKLTALNTRLESQEWGYKEMNSRLEQEAANAKAEALSLRNRVVKAEGALEREKKAIERLESKLLAATGAPKA